MKLSEQKMETDEEKKFIEAMSKRPKFTEDMNYELLANKFFD